MLQINYTNAEIIDHSPLLLVTFWATWCSACKAQNKILEELDELPDHLLLASIDVGENRFLAQKYSVANIPDLLLFKKGKAIHRFSGLISKTQILHQLNNL